MVSLRQSIERILADRKRRRRFATVFICLALVVGLAAERGMRQQGITLTASNSNNAFEIVQTLSQEVLGPNNVATVVEANAPVDALSEDAMLRVEPVSKDAVDQALIQDAVSERTDGKVLDYQVVDVSFVGGDGQTIEPTGDVVMTLTSTLLDTEDAPMVVRLENEQEAAERAESLGLSEYSPETEVLETIDDTQLSRYGLELGKDQVAFEANGAHRYALVTTSLERTLEAGDGSTVTVTVEAPASAGIPADAQLEVEEIERESDAWKDYCAQALETLDAPNAMLSRFFDISITTAEGQIQPKDNVEVHIQITDAPTSAIGADASVVHFGEQPQIVAATEQSGITSFEAKSFSVYGVVYTVDFAYEEYTYSLPGGDQVLLSELLKALQIPAGIDDVTEVEFSNPALMSVEQASDGTTIQRIVPDTTGNANATLQVEETVGDIAEDTEPSDPWSAMEVAPGDYVLTSLAGFETEEVLTVRTSDAVYAVRVTDPVSPSEVASKRNADGSWNLQDVATVDISYDNAYTTAEQDRNASLSFGLTYKISREMMDELRRQFSIWSAWRGDFPTFVYDLGPTVQDSDLANAIPASTRYLTANRKRVADCHAGSR